MHSHLLSVQAKSLQVGPEDGGSSRKRLTQRGCVKRGAPPGHRLDQGRNHRGLQRVSLEKEPGLQLCT